MVSEAWRDALIVVKKEKNKLAEESEWRFRLLRILSHDIKEPMVSALQLLRKLRKGSSAEMDPKIINQLENSQMMIREIISNVESFASAHDHLSLPLAPLSPFEAIEKLTPWLKSRLEDKVIRIDTSKVDAAHTLLVNQESFMYQIFLNLLSNAIKFSPRDSVILLATDQTRDGRVIWKIRDEGKGISKEALGDAHFTEPGTAGESGSGLGIRIALLLAEKQNLKLEWETLVLPERGTEVSILQGPV